MKAIQAGSLTVDPFEPIVTTIASPAVSRIFANARAIAPRPALILADEPTGELDSDTARSIFGLFRSLVDDENVAIVAATHDRAIINSVDKVLELKDGLLAEISRPSERASADA